MGFNIECIPNSQSLPVEFFCSVCQLLIEPNEALQSICTHLYCKPCLSYVASTTMACPYDGYLVTKTDAKPLVESNKVLADTIGGIVVRCLYKNSGCTWLGSLYESSSHCSGCGFGNSHVVCNWCGIQVVHRQGQEHVQVCPGLQQVHTSIQNNAAVATSQSSAQGHVVDVATLTQEEWYQQQYQQYYQNYSGFYMHQQQAPISNSQQQLHLPGLSPQNASVHQVPYVQPEIQYVAQSHSQVQPQPQLQSQSLALHQPHVVFPSAPHDLGAAWLPQGYPSVPPHSQDSSQTFSSSQGLHGLQAHAHSQTTSLSQAHHLQNPQVPPHQLHIQNPMHPQANSVQKSLPQATIGQDQSHQPHAHWNGQKIYPQPNQTNQVGISPNNMPMNHQVGTQPPQVPHVRPPHSLPTMQTQQPSLPSTQHVKQLVQKYGRAPVSKSSGMQPLSKPSLPQQHTALQGGSGHAGACDEFDQRSSTIVEGNGIKRGPLDKQADLGKSHVVEKKGIEDDLSLNGTPLNPASLESARLAKLNIMIENYLKTFQVDSDDDVQRSRAYSLGSLDRGFDQRSPIRPHEPDFSLRLTSRLSQPLTGLGERQFRRGPRSPVSEHLGMPSHGSGPLAHGLHGNRVGTIDIEDIYRLNLPRSEFRGHGNNIQMGDHADMIGLVDVPNHIREGELKEGAGFDSNAHRPGDLGFRSRYTLQGFPGDARSFPGDVEPFPNSRKRATWHVEGLDLHSQNKKLKTVPEDSSPFGYPNKNEESRFRGQRFKDINFEYSIP